MKQILQNLILSLCWCFFLPNLVMSEPTTNRYVVKDNPNAAEPYDTWDNAAADIQTAIDAAVANNGDSVIVAPGIYDTGATWDEQNTNRVNLNKAITVISRDNDPATTIIKGAWDPVSTNGPQSVRCVRMATGAQLIGFTVTNGATASDSIGGDDGGGITCSSTSTIISNCIITACSARRGGGVYHGTLYDCRVEGNLGYQGGGTCFTELYNCVVRKNRTANHTASNWRGGGIYRGSAYSSLIEGNHATYGGGARDADLYNCTIVNNTGGSLGSGIRGGTLYNCISWNNVDLETEAYYSRGDGDTYITNNCTQADPLFIDAANGDWRLRGSSPCIDTGTNQAWMATATDLDGRPRLYNAPDMGCYEYYPQGTVLIVQ